MYLYFDKNGVLQEVINDKKVRSASVGANRIFAYIEGDLEIDEINIVVKRADGLLSNEVSILNNKINASNVCHHSPSIIPSPNIKNIFGISPTIS